MEALHQLEIIIVLLAVVFALTSVARKVLIPYPIILVIGGLVLGMVPGLPTVTLNPDLIFLVFLPPILWAAAYFTSLREFRENLRPISLLAIGLVLATTAAVAVVAHAVFPGMSWAAAIALGAIVSPPDAVAATAIGKRLRIPRRIVTILEGESLVNDATALVLYRTAVGAAASGTFVLNETLLQFVFAAIVGVAIGIGVGMITRWALHRLLSPSLRARDPMPPWSYVFIVAWTGMRGIVTLAAALALPVTTAAGAPFPFRAEIILISFSVILATLVLQGLSLTPLIRALRLEEDRGLEQEEMQAREHAATAAVARLDGLTGEDWLMPDHAERLRVHYGRRLERFARSGTVDEECTVEAAEAFRRLRHETMTAERLALIGLRNDGTISDEVLHRLEHELDVEALRFGIGERRAAT